MKINIEINGGKTNLMLAIQTLLRKIKKLS